MIKEEYTIDSLLGYKLNVQDSSIVESTHKIVFVKSTKSCGKCLMNSIAEVIRMIQLNDVNVNLVILLEEADNNLHAFLMNHGHMKKVVTIINKTLVKRMVPEYSPGVCMFVNSEQRILFATNLNMISNSEINWLFDKAMKYVNGYYI
ncbi:MAG: hypothetical protein AB1394_05780 [Bacteroidota bacterium]